MSRFVMPSLDSLKNELTFATTRSSGPGGQNVNKVNTKVVLKFDVDQSITLDENQKQHVLKSLARYITKENILVLTSQETRSQLQNKEAVIKKFEQLIQKAFTPKKKRKPTRPTKASKQKRLQEKKKNAEKKSWRKGWE